MSLVVFTCSMSVAIAEYDTMIYKVLFALFIAVKVRSLNALLFFTIFSNRMFWVKYISSFCVVGYFCPGVSRTRQAS